MKHFIVEATYLMPFEQMKDVIPQHRTWVEKGYDEGLFLCSGPQNPPTGGILVARANSLAALRAMFEEEPFNVAKAASYTFKEFQPVKRQDWAEHWFSEAAEPAKAGS